MKIKLLLLATILSFTTFAQTTDYPIFNKYRNWEVFVGLNSYEKASISPFEQEYTYTNKTILSYSYGFLYNFHADKKWSFSTGFLTSLEPIYNIKIDIQAKDVYPQFEEGLNTEEKGYSFSTFSFPLLLHRKYQLNEKLHLNFTTGFKTMYFPHGNLEYTFAMVNEEQTELREIFGINADSPINSFQGSIVLGTGLSWALPKILLKSNIIYVANFQNTLEGEYQFANLLSSPPTRGDYTLSGNYIGITISASLLKKKKIKS